MSQPLVSIGVCTYNRPKTLARTLNSLVNQTYRNLEIIVADNCSTDKDVTAVVEYFAKDPRVRYFRHAENKGALFNFNFVLEQFTGTYFMRLADDDWIDHSYVESCISFLSENPDYVSAYGKTQLFSGTEEFVKFDPEIDLSQAGYVERINHYYQQVTQNGLFYGIMHRDFIPFVIARRRLADDWLAVARLAFHGKIKMLTNTHLNLTLGGLGSTIEGIVNAAGLSKFNKFFPYFSIARNVSIDILCNNRVYGKISFRKRLSLARSCFMSLYRRFNIKGEIKGSYKGYIKDSYFFRKSLNNNCLTVL